MRYYETIYIVDPNLDNNVLDKIMEEISKELKKTESKLINHKVWGKKRLAYQIDNQKYGTYVLLHFEEGDQSKMVEFSTWMKLNNSVIRHMTVLLKEKPELSVEEIKKDEGLDKDTPTEKQNNSPEVDEVKLDSNQEKEKKNDQKLEEEK
jgi:small subunit ribosomal protein S6